MSRENAHDKSRRLLAEGRVTVLTVEDDLIVGAVRGDSAAVYRVGWNPADGWTCTCPAVTARCSHARALRLVTVVVRHVRGPT